ncbi:MAG: hypothetical protein KKA73_25680 [Chloroflexi bacterium]|nr:hypothetical protein [Chloroflexota bacterium]MBU1751089.1 hypothetical protein [Chloroflexota bacterium]
MQRLHTDLNRILAYAQANAVASESSELDPATRERLRQLASSRLVKGLTPGAVKRPGSSGCLEERKQ